MNVERANLHAILMDVALHYKHACDKHPHFADEFFHVYANELPCDKFLQQCRGMIQVAAKAGCLDCIQILNCEIAEVMDAYVRGDRQQAREECLDAAAVLLRMVDVLDGLQPLGRPKDDLAQGK